MVLLEDLLKLEFENRKASWQRNSRGWMVSVIEHRRRIRKIIEQSRSLAARLDSFVSETYPDAVRVVAVQMRRRRSAFPAQCPWKKEQLLDSDFFPNPHNIFISD
ncbi:MAG TPA: DUF29 domain-containing protein [Candidatus Binataceae bacterium]|nr:DUF29 domain-containing protein [Candidatus Binataceae bacterium]